MRRRAVGTVPVVLVDDQALFRKGLRAALENAGFPIVREYSSTVAALEDEVLGGKAEPGTVFLCSLGLEGWQELAGQLLSTADCAILGVVDKVTDQVAIEALSNGVLYCLERTQPTERWLEAIREARPGESLSVQMVLGRPRVAQHILMSLPEPPPTDELRPLTPVLVHRERLALSHISEGVPPDQIAQRIGMSEPEVYGVLESARRKLVARHRLLRTLAQLS